MADATIGTHVVSYLRPLPARSKTLMRFRIRAASIVVIALAPVVARAQSTFVVRDVRLFDGERVTEHRSVVVRDGVSRRWATPTSAVPIRRRTGS